MSDAAIREAERLAATGDPDAVRAFRLANCRQGEHTWGTSALSSRCSVCEISRHEHYQNRLRDSWRREANAMRIRCEQGDHPWEPGEDLAESCGCPPDPGIHRCHPRVCSVCEIGEEDAHG